MDNRPLAEIIATGNIDTIIEAAVAYYNGEGGDENRYKAAYLYKNALKIDPKNARVINNLGNCYNNGIGVNKDPDKAKELYRQSAELGFVNAQYNLADSLKSEGDSECIEWYKRAHENGDEDAAYILSLIYKEGLIVPKDITLMIHYLEEASHIGNDSATLDLAFEYMQGDNIPADKAKGAKLMENAAEAGNGIAAGNMALMYTLGDGVEKSKTLAIQWAKKATDLGEPTRLVELATDIYNGNGYEENKTEAVHLFEYAANCDDITAIENLGICYFNGFGVQKDDQKAIEYYERAALLGSKRALDNLESVYESISPEETAAKMFEISNKAAAAGNSYAYIRLHFHYRNGDVVEKDYDTARKYLDMALAENNTMAYYLAGNYCFTGDFQTEKDVPRGIEYWEKAIDLGGSGDMPKIIGDIYRLGQGVDADYKKSIEWYEKAKEISGDPQACFWLGMLYGGAVDDSVVDYEKSAENYEIAHEAGIIAASACLADCYAGGIGVQKDDHRAFELNKVAAEGGFGLSMFKVFQAYQTGTGIEKNDEEAHKWLDKAIEKEEPAACEFQGKVLLHLHQFEEALPLLEIASNAGSAISSTILADLLRDGVPGIEKDEERAFSLYKESAEKGYPEAQWKLGQCYGIGQGCETDYHASREWLIKASENGVVEAWALLAKMYELGIGIDKDTDLAISLYKDVIKNGTGEVVDDAIKSLEALTYEEDENESLPSDIVAQIKKADQLLINQSGVMEAAEVFNTLAESTGDLYCAFKAFLTNANIISSDLHMMKNGLNILDHSVNDADNVLKWASKCQNESNALSTDYRALFSKYKGLAYRIKGERKIIDYPEASIADLRKAVENGDNPSRIMLLYALNKEHGRLISVSNPDFNYIDRLSKEIFKTANDFVENYNAEESEPGDLGGVYEILSSTYAYGIGTAVDNNKSQKYKKLSEEWFEKQPETEDLSKYSNEELIDRAVTSSSYYSKNIEEIDEVLQKTTRKQFREKYIYGANKPAEKTAIFSSNYVSEKPQNPFASMGGEKPTSGSNPVGDNATTVSSFFNVEDIPKKTEKQNQERKERIKQINIKEKSHESENVNNSKEERKKEQNIQKEEKEQKKKIIDEQKRKETIKKIKRILLIACIAIAAIFLVVFSVKTLKPIISPFKYDNGSSSVVASPDNTRNGAKAFVQENTAFYVKDSSSITEDDEGEEIDHTYEVALYSADISGKNEEVIFTTSDDVESATLDILNDNAYVFEKLIFDYDVDDHQKSRVEVVDLSSGEIIDSFQPDIIDARSSFIMDNRIVYIWDGWRGEDAVQCISTSNLDGSGFMTIYESLGNFDFTRDEKKLYISDTTWDYDNDTGRHVIFTINPSGEEERILFDEEIADTDSYLSGLYLTDQGLIQTRSYWSYDDDDEHSYYQLIAYDIDSGDMNVISEWNQLEYSNAYGDNVYGNYYYFNYYNEKRQDYEIRRTNISTGETEKVLDLPDVPYMEGPSLDILLFDNYIVLNMREMDYEEDLDIAINYNRNRIFTYDLNGKKLAEL